MSEILVPAWYDVEKKNLIGELRSADKVVITSDGWTSITMDDYITVKAHYITEGQLKEKVISTLAVYESQTGPVIAEEIGDVLQSFKIREKVVAMTVDNAANTDVAARLLGIRKLGCYAHLTSLAAQKIYNVQAIARWAARIRDAVVWIKKSAMVKNVVAEKERQLGKNFNVFFFF